SKELSGATTATMAPPFSAITCATPTKGWLSAVVTMVRNCGAGGGAAARVLVRVAIATAVTRHFMRTSWRWADDNSGPPPPRPDDAFALKIGCWGGRRYIRYSPHKAPASHPAPA